MEPGREYEFLFISPLAVLCQSAFGCTTGGYSMSIVIMGIGVAGSGKTTVLKGLADTYGFAYISRDTIAHALTGNPHDQSRRAEVANQANAKTLIAIAREKSVVLDSTFVDRDKRRQQITYLRRLGAKRVVGIYFNTPFPEACRRNRERTFVVPFSIVCEQHEKLAHHPPSTEDGFDRLYLAAELEELKEELKSE